VLVSDRKKLKKCRMMRRRGIICPSFMELFFFFFFLHVPQGARLLQYSFGIPFALSHAQNIM